MILICIAGFAITASRRCACGPLGGVDCWGRGAEGRRAAVEGAEVAHPRADTNMSLSPDDGGVEFVLEPAEDGAVSSGYVVGARSSPIAFPSASEEDSIDASVGATGTLPSDDEDWSVDVTGAVSAHIRPIRVRRSGGVRGGGGWRWRMCASSG